MIVFVLDCAPASVRGELTRWFLEVKPGVFVGNVYARVRQLLWERVCENPVNTGAIMIYNVKSEQGFALEVYGLPKRTVVDFEGVQLIKITSGCSSDT